MRRITLLCLATMLGMPAPTSLMRAAFAQQVDTAGKAGTRFVANWQGILHAGQDVRLILKVTQAPEGGFRSTLYSADPGGTGLPVKTTLKNSELTLDVESFGAKYIGKLSGDGNSIIGSWQQAGQSVPLIFARATPDTEWRAPDPPKKISPMAADLHPVFDVATIKPSPPGTMTKMFRLEGRRFSAINMSTVELIAFAYGLQGQQVLNGPSWLATEKLDVVGEPDAAGQPSEHQLKEMVKKLLAERFQLTFHNGQKDLAAYVLEVSTSGPKLARSEANAGENSNMFFTKIGSLTVRNATMKDFAGLIQSAVFDRPVVDRTGLNGRWNFVLNWTPDESQFATFGVKIPSPSDAADAPPPIFVAIQEQVGLKLVSKKTNVDVMILDKVAKPSEN